MKTQPETDLHDAPLPDSIAGSWVDKAPVKLRPYLRLARFDRTIGAWLLMWPCWWSLAFAAPHRTQYAPLYDGMLDGRGFAWLPDPVWLLLFFIGAKVMRGAGCTFNDIIDRDFDAGVERTKNRPIPAGLVSVAQAAAWCAALSLTGIAILLTFNTFAIVVGLISAVTVIVYPFAKRFTFWPQFFLGLSFNWGALLGWAVSTGGLPWEAAILYLFAIAWTLGYDTIYAFQDIEDDPKVGVKSSARALGHGSKPALYLFYALFLSGLAWIGMRLSIGWPFYAGLAVAASHAVWQIWTLKTGDPQNCLDRFWANRTFGWIIFAAIVLGNAAAEM